MTAISLTVNGRTISAEVEPRTHLGDFLRDHLRLTGTHLGCEHGVCGACTVLISGAPARACITYAVACDGLEIRTIEGFEEDALMADLREAFSREHGLQCGFCTAGMLISARDIVERLPGADERRIRTELSGNLCRCTGYVGIVNAVKSVTAKQTAPAVAPSPSRRVATGPSLSHSVGEGRKRPSPAPGREREGPAAQQREGEGTREGWTRIDESFVIAAPPAAVWRALADFPKVAACLPGAELTEHDAHSAKGRLRVKLGPMAASFAGSATVQRDDAAMTGIAKGAGTDSGSRSRTRGELEYRLTPEAGGQQTRVAVTVQYDLQGPLAQFSRSNLARDFAARVVAEFAANLNRALGTNGAHTTEPPRQLNILGLAWSVVWERLKRLLGRSR
ncbi:MAG TPA: 2Fe-2S iron-sulfur cluster-binding protein [Stellaceae bacterium]|nr:2Fe-2S iron-sulfur cluster-binding protein [Stellaceae bacterium]